MSMSRARGRSSWLVLDSIAPLPQTQLSKKHADATPSFRSENPQAPAPQKEIRKNLQL